MPELRIFLASRKSAALEEIISMERTARKVILKILGDSVKVTLTTSDRDHLENFARLGGWVSWIEYVATGLRYDDREPVYNAFLIYETDLGRANADILRKALEAGKLCMYLDPSEETLTHIDRIVEVDPTNWKNGWAAILR